jgi:hypothetical protein
MIQSLAIKYSDDYIVFWKVESVEAVEDQYQLQIVSRSLEKGNWQETKKEFFMTKEQLNMLYSFFNGVHNELNK